MSRGGALSTGLTARIGHDRVATSLVTGMVNEPVPSPETASYAMQYATRGSGTKEPVIWRFVGRMNRHEIARMNRFYLNRTGEHLYDRLGLYGRGPGELSGSDRLRGERMFRGMARTDREKAEAAIYAILQQRRETGGTGAALAEGTLTDRMMGDSLRDLREVSGGRLIFGASGIARWSGETNFDPRGTFTGTANQQAAFAETLAGAEQSARSYQSLIDHYASQASLAIMVVGIIAAAVVTIATGGAAGPLLMAAIAGAAGLGGMAAKSAIRGGGYGWEEAAVDLGMTAVDMLTAGVGQGLGLASRGGMQAARQGMRAGLSLTAARQLNRSLTRGLAQQAGRRGTPGQALRLAEDVGRGALLTGSRLGDQLAIGAITGGLGGLGQGLLDERTYAEGGPGVLGNLFLSTLQGATVGSVTSGVTFGAERGLGRLTGLGRALEDISGDTNLRGILARGGIEGVSAGAGSFVGTGVQLAADAARGRFKGDFGEALQTMASEGLKNAAQGTFEGIGGGMVERRRRTRAGEAHVQPAETAPRPAADTEGTAAGIAESTMRGDFLDTPRSQPPDPQGCRAAGA